MDANEYRVFTSRLFAFFPSVKEWSSGLSQDGQNGISYRWNRCLAMTPLATAQDIITEIAEGTTDHWRYSEDKEKIGALVAKLVRDRLYVSEESEAWRKTGRAQRRDGSGLGQLGQTHSLSQRDGSD